MEKKKALVIAVSRYDDESLASLDFCENDGKQMHAVLKEIGYEIPESNKLTGYVEGIKMSDAIIEFFSNPDIKSSDTILFYFSGHGVVSSSGEVYLSSSNMETKSPRKRGFSFDDLTTQMQECRSKRIVTVLDCCYSGSAKISKSDEQSRVASAAKYLNQQSTKLKQGDGKCILSASLGYEEAFATLEGDHSVFTACMLKGLRGANGKSVDEEGIVTPETLMNYVDLELDNLPIGKKPNQTPLRKIEVTGKIILAEYPQYSQKSVQQEAKTKISDLISQPGLSTDELKQRLAIMYGLEHKMLDEIEIKPEVIHEKATPKISKDTLSRIEEIKDAKEELHEKLEKLGEKPAVDVSLTLKEANLGYFVGNYDEADKLYERVLEVEPENTVARKNKELVASRLDKALGKEKTWKNKNVDIKSLAKQIEKFFQDEGYKDVMIVEDEAGNWYDVQAKKSGIASTLSGTRKAIHVLVEKNPTGFKVSMTLGEWGKNIAIAAGTAFLTWGVSSAIGMAANAKFRKKLWNHIVESVRLLENTGGRNTGY